MAIPNFGQMKELYSLQKKAKQVQKELKDLEIEAKSIGGEVTVLVSGEMKVTQIDLSEAALQSENKRQLENAIKETVNQAMAKAQSESAARMQPILKDMNLPGM
ncbi:MAG TPA: YbaB/EbfC family nucleoid-associated protein [Candidatus Saccharimonadales bacterium]|nr:YbaB/EbfC family nucleoid-associated protein [Candidatus Saccharimonadales bacterium]